MKREQRVKTKRKQAIIYAWLLVVVSLLQFATTARAADAILADLERISISDTMLMMPMRDGVRLASDIYRPKDAKGKVPIIFIKTPYNFNKLAGASLQWTYDAVQRGYAVVMQNERGRYYSEGDWTLLGDPRTDGYDAMTWMANQPWSNGNVGTLGCSSSAEWQLALAAQHHPAHKAMVPMSAGAGIGNVGEFMEQGNWYKGGVHQTLFSVWLYSVQQTTYPRFPVGLPQEELQRLRKMYDLAPDMPEVDWKKQLASLPMIDWLESAGGNTGPFREMIARTPADPAWSEGGLYHEKETIDIPAFWFNTWFDVSQGPNIALYSHVREKAPSKGARDGQYMLIAPTLHCGYYRIEEHEDLVVGELNVGNPWFSVNDNIFTFLDHYLKNEKSDAFKKLPRVQYYTLGENNWKTDEDWPPAHAKAKRYYLASSGEANSLFGDGRLEDKRVSGEPSDSFQYDPMNPVPALGGGVCCNSDAAKGGSFDQRGIEARADVLVYTSEPLGKDLEVTGSIHPVLYVSSSAKDTDFTVKLVDVYPDGTAYNVDDTIFRARYRNGYDKPEMMQSGEVYEIRLTAMTTSYLFKEGHRLRVEVSSSKFPQYARNLNTGGNNYDETEGVEALNTVWHSAEHPSYIELSVVP
ncbi:MAG TPA: CocE/NonD family hydrolase [Woeseiaceae bacterium]|nr:CocE/NonD family hydrolase [Woeseiaceae bacterium]